LSNYKNINKGVETKVGFDSVKAMINDFCKGDIGKNLVAEMQFISDASELNNLLQTTFEIKSLIQQGNFPSMQEYFSLDETLDLLAVEGSYLETEQLVVFRNNYQIYTDFYLYLSKVDAEKFPLITSLNSNNYIDEDIIQLISEVINDFGEVRDDASELLREIRAELSKSNQRIESTMQRCLKQSVSSGILPSDTEIVIRNGISVIPIKSANKRQIKGLVIDESSTGQTSYIQPFEVIEAINKKKELELAERREIVKILIQLTSELRPHFKHFKDATHFLGKLDFVIAKAKFSIDNNCNLPQLTDQPIVDWKNAKHPLLNISLKKQGKKIVPSSIKITSDERIIVLSGPNAGGKSVTLKTLGLLQYMLQCGILIPVDDGSVSGIFEHIFIDIGDHQSIENDLSTYSSHLLHIKQLLEIANEKTLFLIDEFGSGTDPQSGGAIAEAVLEQLNSVKAKGLVTTHYSNLKKMAYEQDGFVNAAMLFDMQLIKPLYKLSIGNAGSSFAFEIAASIDFPADVIDKASGKVGYSHLNFERELQNLDAEKDKILQQKKQIAEADKTLNQLVEKYETQIKELNESKQAELKKAYKEAQDIISNANKIIENTVKNIKETKANKENIKKQREIVKQFKDEVAAKNKELSDVKLKSKSKSKKKSADAVPVIAGAEVVVGSIVKLPDSSMVGEVVNINQNEALIAFDNLKMKANINQLQVVHPNYKGNIQQQGSSASLGKFSLSQKSEQFKSGIDVRGKTAQEATDIVEKYLQEASMLHVYSVEILHGKGDGILRNVIRQMLLKNKLVKSFEEAPIEMGGSGITIVNLY
jgi:DNA mismatch repair protein MutS2